ncbi:HNH endonuclease signature motif containing protein [Paenalcaligenes sp. Me131]|uniref:HNH endonuclease signature motif containing protein n=1 Tax=Paenalcaligenes sp. Me131 TaxID=3392636 RepID=UPI003D27F26B
MLYDNKWTCCICRSRTDSVIVHHIDPWVASRSHNANNLAVLCPNDHSKGDLTQNLTPERLRKIKKLWRAK